jgi:hypothetical protein
MKIILASKAPNIWYAFLSSLSSLLNSWKELSRDDKELSFGKQTAEHWKAKS